MREDITITVAGSLVSDAASKQPYGVYSTTNVINENPLCVTLTNNSEPSGQEEEFPEVVGRPSP